MDYTHTYSDVIIRYKASSMYLYVESDAVYLVLPKACSRGTGHFYLIGKLKSMDKLPQPKTNGPILT